MQQVKKILTENPFVDEVIYNAKLIAMNCVIKMQEEQDVGETLESQRQADLYTICYEGRMNYGLIPNPIPIKVLLDAGISSWYITKYIATPEDVPMEYRDLVLKSYINYMLNDYKELNPYVRKIAGLPPLDANKNEYNLVPLKDYQFETAINSGAKYIHEVNKDELDSLVHEGIIDKMKNDHPTYTYLKYLEYRISVYKIRQANGFDLLYIPNVGSTSIITRWIDFYNKNAMYVKSVVYSEAYKFKSDYYDNMMTIIIVLNTLLDMLATVQDHIVNKDIVDPRCISYIFSIYGVPYYDEIPIKYQMAICKNLNKLLRFKSTAECMVDLTSLFGCKDITIFKYYLLRERVTDDNGDPIFYYTKIKHPKDLTTTKTAEATLSYDSKQPITINFPFKDYLALGNKIIVYLDNKEVNSTLYYIDQYDHLIFFDPSILKGVKQVNVEFYYSKDHFDDNKIPPHKVIQNECTITLTKDVYTYKIPYPIDDFIKKNGHMEVLIGEFFLDSARYTINEDSGEITLNKEDIELVYMMDKEYHMNNNDYKYPNMKFLFFYSDNFEIKQSIKKVTAEQMDQMRFIIPEPFPGYVDAGNQFFLSIGGVLISNERYMVNGNSLIFTNYNSDRVFKNRELTFHFIWNDFTNVEICSKIIKIKATKDYQRVFDIEYPIPDYLDSGNCVFIKINGAWINPSGFECFKNHIQIELDGVYVALNNELEVLLIYPKINTNIDETKTVRATMDKQLTFDIPFPFDHFLSRGNKMYISSKGQVIDPVKYQIVNNKIEFYSPKDGINLGTELRFHFIYNKENQYFLTIVRKMSSATIDNQMIFKIDLPFPGYFKSGNKMLVYIGGIYIPESWYKLYDNRIVFNKDKENNLVTLIKDRDVYFVFIYHTIYDQLDVQTHVDEQNMINLDDYKNCTIEIPFPFDNFLQEGNIYKVQINGVNIPQTEYDILNFKYLVFDDINNIIKKYGTHLKHIFIYSGGKIGIEYLDDNTRDWELKFIKVPLLDDRDKYLKNANYKISYDEITNKEVDPTWDGPFYHEDIKRRFLNNNFNIIRSKYFSLDYLAEMSDMSFKCAYFLRMLFDSVKCEERLAFTVPYLGYANSFKLNDLFTFLYILTFEFNGVSDEIFNDMARVMYLKGFNFKVDLAKVGEYIRSTKTFTADDLGVSDFIIPKGQIPTIKQLLNIFTKNTEIYHHLSHEIVNASNKRIYDIYKKMYDSYMIQKFNNEYYMKSDGTVYKTLTEFIKDRNETLYEWVLKVRAIQEIKDKRKKIIEIIDEVSYAIESYMGTDDFNCVFGQFSGSDQPNMIVAYLTKVIRWFKSYKVTILEGSTTLVFDDKLDNTIRAIDQINLEDYMKIKDDGDEFPECIKSISVLMNKKEDSFRNFREKIKNQIEWYLDSHLVTNYRDALTQAIAGIILDKHILYYLFKDIGLTRINSIMSYFETTDQFYMIIDRILQNDVDFLSKLDIKIRENQQFVREYFRLINMSEDGMTKFIKDLVILSHVLSFNQEFKIKDFISKIISYFSPYTLLEIDNNMIISSRLIKSYKLDLRDNMHLWISQFDNMKIIENKRVPITIQRIFNAYLFGDNFNKDIKEILTIGQISKDYGYQMDIKDVHGYINSMDYREDLVFHILEKLISRITQLSISEKILIKDCVKIYHSMIYTDRPDWCNDEHFLELQLLKKVNIQIHDSIRHENTHYKDLLLEDRVNLTEQVSLTLR